MNEGRERPECRQCLGKVSSYEVGCQGRLLSLWELEGQAGKLRQKTGSYGVTRSL